MWNSARLGGPTFIIIFVDSVQAAKNNVPKFQGSSLLFLPSHWHSFPPISIVKLCSCKWILRTEVSNRTWWVHIHMALPVTSLHDWASPLIAPEHSEVVSISSDKYLQYWDLAFFNNDYGHFFLFWEDIFPHIGHAYLWLCQNIHLPRISEQKYLLHFFFKSNETFLASNCNCDDWLPMVILCFWHPWQMCPWNPLLFPTRAGPWGQAFLSVPKLAPTPK